LTVLTTLVVGAGQDNAIGRLDRSQKDGHQLRTIEHALLVFASENNGDLMRPGHFGHKDGGEDLTRNTTAALYSALITQRYVALADVVSPVDRNPNVSLDDDFNFDSYDPARSVYWDASFAADLAAGSNVSYAHVPIVGARADRLWRNDAGARSIHLSNRGPIEGGRNVDSHTCDPHGYWSGWVVFADGHAELIRDMTPTWPDVENDDNAEPDNLFAFDRGIDGDDVLLTFTQAIINGKPKMQHD
jgi:hypothetical protein